MIEYIRISASNDFPDSVMTGDPVQWCMYASPGLTQALTHGPLGDFN